MQALEDVHNYYEQLVLDHIHAHWNERTYHRLEELLPDIICMTLNQLPPRYVRYEIDMAFFLNSEERAQMQSSVAEAFEKAVAMAKRHRRHDKLVEQGDETFQVKHLRAFEASTLTERDQHAVKPHNDEQKKVIK